METIRKHISEYNVISLSSRWISDSQVRVRVRQIGHSDKIAVDLFELSPEGKEVCKGVLNRIACDAAMLNGAASRDYCVIRDFLTARKAMRLDGSVTATNIREKTYVFHGVNS